MNGIAFLGAALLLASLPGYLVSLTWVARGTSNWREWWAEGFTKRPENATVLIVGIVCLCLGLTG